MLDRLVMKTFFSIRFFRLGSDLLSPGPVYWELNWENKADRLVSLELNRTGFGLKAEWKTSHLDLIPRTSTVTETGSEVLLLEVHQLGDSRNQFLDPNCRF